MYFFQLAATWLFPCAVCATMAPMAEAMVKATDGASIVEQGSAPPPVFSAGGINADADPGSSPSASSTTSSSSSSLLGARCVSPNSARSTEKQDGGGAATPRGDAMRRFLRRLTRKLPTGADDVRPGGRRRRKKSRSTKPDTRGAAVVDGTAREREEAVAGAITYCKERMNRRRSGTSSPSLDAWLLDRPEEASHRKCPVLRRDISLLAWLPEAPACTSSAAVPHHRGCAACNECDGKSVAETGKRASRRGPAGELGMDDILDELDMDVLRITSYFAANYGLRDVEQLPY